MPNALSSQKPRAGLEPDLILTMRSSLDAAAGRTDRAHRTSATLAKMAERILRTASDGVTNVGTLTAVAIEEGRQPAD
jgi:hypothetical protein